VPLDLAIGDPFDFLSAGAYTASYASVEFNGFPPLRTYCDRVPRRGVRAAPILTLSGEFGRWLKLPRRAA
jgi:hypothetical protein